MHRLRFYDLRLSRLPDRVGLCMGDIPQLANYINSAQERLINAKEMSDEGPWGTFAEVRFNVSRANPYITCPREIARLEMMDVCGQPVPLNNQFGEYLQWGAGRQPARWENGGAGCGFWGNRLQGYTRNNAITFVDLLPTPQTIRVYSTDAADYASGKRVLIQGLDANGLTVYSQDVNNQVEGIFVNIDSPFVDTPMTFSKITGIQKDPTSGQIQFFQVNPATGTQYPLHTMEPSEQTALYRRYYLNQLPLNCCHTNQNPCQPLSPGNSHHVQVSAMAKLDLVPVTCDTDYCLIQSEEAIINECEAIRYEGTDFATAHAMADRKHKVAVRLLIGQMANYLGINEVAVTFSPFGSARPIVSMV